MAPPICQAARRLGAKDSLSLEEEAKDPPTCAPFGVSLSPHFLEAWDITWGHLLGSVDTKTLRSRNPPMREEMGCSV